MRNKAVILIIALLLLGLPSHMTGAATGEVERVFYVNDYAMPEDIEKLVYHNCCTPSVSLSDDGLSVLRIENTKQTHSNASGLFYPGKEGTKNSSIPVDGASELIFEYRFRMASHCNKYDYFGTWDTSEVSAIIGGYNHKDKLRLKSSGSAEIGSTDQDKWNTYQFVYSNKDGTRKIYLNGDFIYEVKETDADFVASKYSEGGFKSFKPHFVAYLRALGDYCEVDYIRLYSAADYLNAESAETRGNPREVYIKFDSGIFRVLPSMFKIDGVNITGAMVYDASENIVRLTLDKELDTRKDYKVRIDGVSNYKKSVCNAELDISFKTAWASEPEFIQNDVVVEDYEYTDLPVKVRSSIRNYRNEAKDFSLYMVAYGYKEGNAGRELIASDIKTVTVPAESEVTAVTDGIILPSGVTEVKAFVWENELPLSSVGTAGKTSFESKENGIPDFEEYKSLGYAAFAKKTGAASTGLTASGYRTYVAMIGTPGYVFEFDTHTGKFLGSYQSGSGLQHAIKVGSDGKVYTMPVTGTELWAYDPVTGENISVAKVTCNASHTWHMNYGATNDGKEDKSMLYMPLMGKEYATKGTPVIEYDIDNGKATLYEGFDPGCKYSHAATGDENYVYAASSDSNEVATVSRLDKKTGEMVVYEDEKGRTTGGVTFLKIIGDYVFTRFSSSIVVIDKQTMKKVDEFEGGRGQADCITEPDPENPDIVYYNSNGGSKIGYYNLKTKEVGTAMTIPTTYANPVRYDFGRWIPDKNGVMGIAGVGGNADNPGLFHINPAKGLFNHIYCEFSQDTPGVPTRVSYFYLTREDILYIGGYEAGLNGFDLKTKTPIFSVENGNQHGMTMVGGKIFGGSYGNDGIYMYDPDKPVSKTNPKKVSSLTGVCRYYHTSDTNAGFGLISGIADYGGTQGGVILVTYLNGAPGVRHYYGVIPGENIVGVAYRNGYIYAGSSVRIPQHEADQHEEAHVAKIDAKTGETVLMTTVNFEGLPKTTKIGEIAFGPDGLLYGKANAGQTIFALNPVDLSLVKYKSYYPDVTPEASVTGERLIFGTEGNLYAILDNALHCINPKTMESEIVWDTVQYFHIDNDGNILKRSGSTSNGNMLVSIGVDSRQRFETMVKNAQEYYKEEDYTKESWESFRKVLDEAAETKVSEMYYPDILALARRLGFAINDLQTVYDGNAGYAFPFK